MNGSSNTRCVHNLIDSSAPLVHSVSAQRLYREIILWQSLDHPHILPFLGVDAVNFPDLICMVSPWMHRGNLLENIKARQCTMAAVNGLVSWLHITLRSS